MLEARLNLGHLKPDARTVSGRAEAKRGISEAVLVSEAEKWYTETRPRFLVSRI